MSARQTVGPATNSGTIDVPSAASLSLKVVTPQYDILVYRISIGGPAQSLAKVFVGNVVSSAEFRSVSYQGQQDDADYPAGLLVSRADQLLIVWYNYGAPDSINAPGNITGSAAGAALAVAEFQAAP